MRTELTWRKSSYSGGSQTECVEIAEAAGVFVRDSKDPEGPNLAFDANAWNAFVTWAASLEV
ncbi:DUF397 domain-containing protein [Streptomyces sp. NRRL WC-3742]|uniref:DUF397 domain-containing protein n=1 Tax=Streptomyces sp. NRRL WC-3742 TaxID=1463934 RepID=UPI0004C685F1|nr:DUF397 domain-containing protein [Streptomyces sp. NRRL WC-3742]